MRSPALASESESESESESASESASTTIRLFHLPSNMGSSHPIFTRGAVNLPEIADLLKLIEIVRFIIIIKVAIPARLGDGYTSCMYLKDIGSRITN